VFLFFPTSAGVPKPMTVSEGDEKDQAPTDWYDPRIKVQQWMWHDPARRWCFSLPALPLDLEQRLSSNAQYSPGVREISAFCFSAWISDSPPDPAAAAGTPAAVTSPASTAHRSQSAAKDAAVTLPAVHTSPAGVDCVFLGIFTYKVSSHGTLDSFA